MIRATALAVLVAASAPAASQVGWGGDAQRYQPKSAGVSVSETGQEVRIALSADVLFDFDKAVINPKAADALAEAAALIRRHGPRGAVRIEGHTDSKGAADYNRQLSERRAEAVRAWLDDTGELKRVTFQTQGFGAKRPVARNTKPDGSDDPKGRTQNRRVEIVITRR